MPLALLCLCLVGCRSGGRRPDPDQLASDNSTELAARYRADSPLPTPAPAAAGRERRLHLQFEVLRVDMPADSIRHTHKVWNHVDELRYDAQLAARLGRNGLRVGAAPASAWPAMRTIFQSCSAQVREARQVTQPGVPLLLELGSIVDAETIFSFDSEGHMAGKTHPAGQKLVEIRYELHPERGDTVDVEVQLEVREPLSPGDWQPGDGLLYDAPTHHSHTFPALHVALTLQPGEFLVIGPSEVTARNRYIVGGRFFTDQREGQSYDTILCIAPQPYRVPAPNRQADAGKESS